MTTKSHLFWVMKRACLDKKGLSKESADRIVDSEASKGKLLFYYKCEFCSRYHITKRCDEIKKTVRVL